MNGKLNYGIISRSGELLLLSIMNKSRSVFAAKCDGMRCDVPLSPGSALTKDLVLYFKGSRVWLLEGKDWVPATVTESNGGQVTFRTEYDKVSFHVNESLKTVCTTRHALIATIVRTSPPILA